MCENPDTWDPRNGTAKGTWVHLAPAGRYVYSPRDHKISQAPAGRYMPMSKSPIELRASAARRGNLFHCGQATRLLMHGRIESDLCTPLN